MQAIKRLTFDKAGVTLIEYGLIAMLIALVSSRCSARSAPISTAYSRTSAARSRAFAG